MPKHRVLALATALLLLLAACGEDDEAAIDEQPDDDAAAEDEPEPEDEDDDAEEAPAEEDEGAEVALADSDLGEILVDGDGLSLYLFEADEDGESTCYGDCATNWPPLLTEGDPVPGDGVDGGLLATAEREDGSAQVTYAGHPLYYWVGDEEPGDVEGQGVQDVWWLVDAEGNAVDEEDGDDDAGGY